MTVKELKKQWKQLTQSERTDAIRELIDLGVINKKKLSDAIGINYRTLRAYYTFGSSDHHQRNRKPTDRYRTENTKKPNGSVPEKLGTATIEWDGDNVVMASLDKVPFRTPAECMEHLGLDPNDWEAKGFKVKLYQGYAAQKAQSCRMLKENGDEYIAWERPEKTDIITKDLYSITCRFERKVLVITARNEIQAMMDLVRDELPTLPPFIRRLNDTGNMLEISIPDLHLGKLAWHRETNWEDYDSKIAEMMFEEACETLAARTSGVKFDKVCFIVGNDFYNADNKALNTTRGTPQAGSTDTRYQKMFTLGREMLVKAIRRFTAIGDVDVIGCPGNHDELSAWFVTEMLGLVFQNSHQVRIFNNDPSPTKYYEWGKCMLLWAHGHAPKPNKLPNIMPAEQPEMWGRTKFREAHTGHLHKVMSDEVGGMRWRVFPALCSPDEWHAHMGFTGNLRSADAYMWNKEDGLLGTASYTVPPISRRAMAA